MLNEQKSKEFFDFVQTRKGYVYAMRPPDQPGILKIGRTSKNPFIREKTLSSAGVMWSFRLLWVEEFANVTWAESKIHQELKSCRVVKEFFKIELPEVKLIFEKYRNKELDLLTHLQRDTLLTKSYIDWVSSLDVSQIVDF